MKRRPWIWVAGFLLLTVIALGSAALLTARTDPFFHYHKPYTEDYYYPLDNERSQNDGIVKHFDYTGLITGTSMAENFSASEAEFLWGGTFVKVPSSGGSYKELNDMLRTALKHNPELKVIIRGLDMDMFMDDKDRMRTDLGVYPTYLYDENPFNDVHYLFNRDVFFSRVYPMLKNKYDIGIDLFDEYANWMEWFRFGKNTLYPDGITAPAAGEPVHLTEEEAERVRANVRQNVTALAEEYPGVTYYCFITPYSAGWWMKQVENGTACRVNETERIVIEEILKCPSIRLYSFNTRFDITTDLNHYKDLTHYGEWINSLILQSMCEGKGLLTAENYNSYLEEELAFYTSYDYTQMNAQDDYEDDYEAVGTAEM